MAHGGTSNAGSLPEADEHQRASAPALVSLREKLVSAAESYHVPRAASFITQFGWLGRLPFLRKAESKTEGHSDGAPDPLAHWREIARSNLVAVGIFSVFVNLLMLTMPIYLFQISDRVLTSHSLDTLLMLSLVVIGLIAVLTLLDTLRRQVLSRLATRMETILGGQALLESWVLSLNMTPTQFMILSMAIIFVLGWPLEWTEIIIIFVPIFLPLLDDFHVDPIFFGILVALNTQTASNTPPVAMAAFYLKGVAPPQVKLTDIFNGALPFVFMVFLTMALVYVFPQLALWLPDYLYTPR